MKQETHPRLHSASTPMNVNTCETDTALMFGAKDGETE